MRHRDRYPYRLLASSALIAALWIGAPAHGGIALAASSPAPAPTPGEASPSDRIPNTALIDQDGRKVHFYDDLVKGRVVLINFMFTQCDAYCPLETARLKRVQDILGARMGKDVFFYSVSFDPENDTPEALQAYRERYGIGPGWSFLTGDKAAIDELRTQLGLKAAEVDEKARDHGLDLLVGNEATGQWMRRSNMDHPEVLARLLGENLSEWRTPVGTAKAFAEAPLRIADMEPGKKLFSTRCVDCHTIGGGDGIGPDLKGVSAARDPAWLKAWLLGPSKMAASKDPQALALIERFQGLVMPSLGLSEADVTDLIDYLAKHTR
jgi:cytochrome oxidase Cu insertion factor (SCO1/SenC/PrrC family)